MYERISSRPFRYTPGRIMVPSAVKTSLNAPGSWAAQASTMRMGTAAAAAWSSLVGVDTPGDLLVVIFFLSQRVVGAEILPPDRRSRRSWRQSFQLRTCL